MTRRWYGASEQTVNGYHIDTLSNDILAVTKALHLDKVILIGHSIAGDEISKFAASYPDKVDKVVYLDAAYDRTNLMSIIMSFWPGIPNATTQDSLSMDKLKAYYTYLYSIAMPDEEYKNIMVFSKDGK